MIELRIATSDADVQTCLDIRRVVLPNESAGTVEFERARAKPDRVLALATLDGEIAGYGFCGRSDLPDRFGIASRVLPDRRRRGVGTALLHALAAHAVERGARKVQSHIDDDGSRAFAERFGFVETDREVEQVKQLHGPAAGAPPVPEGLEIVSLAERPELLRAAYPLAREGFADLATEVPATLELDAWLADELITVAGGTLVALDGGEVVAFTGLIAHDTPGIAEDGLTVVRRDRRRRGLAVALKRIKLAWAADNGYREIVTWTQRGNAGMRSVNERLGYEYRTESLTMVAPVPLPTSAAREKHGTVKRSG